VSRRQPSPLSSALTIRDFLFCVPHLMCVAPQYLIPPAPHIDLTQRRHPHYFRKLLVLSGGTVVVVSDFRSFRVFGPLFVLKPVARELFLFFFHVFPTHGGAPSHPWQAILFPLVFLEGLAAFFSSFSILERMRRVYCQGLFISVRSLLSPFPGFLFLCCSLRDSPPLFSQSNMRITPLDLGGAM